MGTRKAPGSGSTSLNMAPDRAKEKVEDMFKGAPKPTKYDGKVTSIFKGALSNKDLETAVRCYVAVLRRAGPEVGGRLLQRLRQQLQPGRAGRLSVCGQHQQSRMMLSRQALLTWHTSKNPLPDISSHPAILAAVCTESPGPALRCHHQSCCCCCCRCPGCYRRFPPILFLSCR